MVPHYFKRSADQGRANEQFNFGLMLNHGERISTNKSLTAFYFKLAA
jgi:TPR repeat protein